MRMTKTRRSGRYASREPSLPAPFMGHAQGNVDFLYSLFCFIMRVFTKELGGLNLTLARFLWYIAYWLIATVVAIGQGRDHMSMRLGSSN